MLRKLAPDTVMKPYNNAYSHGVVIPPNAAILHIAGQVGVRPDGTLPDGIEAQADQAWRNVMAILAEAGMGPDDLVKINIYMLDEADFPVFAAVRKRYLGATPPASTAVFVRQLVDPAWRVEIEAIAAK